MAISIENGEIYFIAVLFCGCETAVVKKFLLAFL